MHRRWYAALILIVLLIGYGDYSFATGAQHKLDTFESQVCTLSTASRGTNAKLNHLLGTLTDRARQREAIDQAAGNDTAAQADHDSAVLYLFIEQLSNPQPGPGLGC